MKKILLYIMVVAGMVSMQSCLHDDKELFDESAANRLEHATEETKQISVMNIRVVASPSWRSLRMARLMFLPILLATLPWCHAHPMM